MKPYNDLQHDLKLEPGTIVDMKKFWRAARECKMARQAKHQVYPSLRRRYNADGSIRNTFKKIGQELGISIQAARAINISRLRRMRHGDMHALYEVSHE